MNLREEIREILDKNKANMIETFDLSDSDYFCDYVIVANAMGTKHLKALLSFIKDVVRKKDILNIEESDEWIAIDLGDTVVHLMSKKCRDTYKVEEFLSTFSK